MPSVFSSVAGVCGLLALEGYRNNSYGSHTAPTWQLIMHPTSDMLNSRWLAHNEQNRYSMVFIQCLWLWKVIQIERNWKEPGHFMITAFLTCTLKKRIICPSTLGQAKGLPSIASNSVRLNFIYLFKKFKIFIYYLSHKNDPRAVYSIKNKEH